ncbi:TPR repeat-containing protein [Novosphingobium nitrogenifigens DSM 19370]|uniref:TPR repeat-containing protein n=1 Tax=Novosphingobium nitrogenifigens DSM 19370 TaxID=983920 RepID=F1Z913_9SPHN|nr:tetratricopeptide repeat protein [Novosphingobium nitrogenifigens]EGD58827.1 TPR repeat-containing protein [Novosphingobium nitrogenifigens DSM 19370]
MNLVLCLALPLSTLAGCHRVDPVARFADARQAFAAEDYGRARTAVLAALDADENNRDMLLLLARTDLALHDGDGAQTALGRLRDAGAKGQDLTEMTAEAALLRGQGPEALRLLAGDQRPQAWRLRAAVAQADGDSGGALAAFRHGMEAGDDYALAAAYAHFLLEGGDLDEADRVLAIMRRLGPGRLDTLMTAGLIAQHKGQLDQASAAFRQAADRFRTRPEPIVALADIADMQGHVDVAAGYAAKANERAPGDPQVEALVVRVAAEKGEWQKVRDILAPREDSLDVRTFEGLAYGEALLNLGRPEQARAIYAKALLLSPQNPYARLMLAESQLAAGASADALRTVRPLADSVLAGQRELDLAVRAAQAASDPVAGAYAARLHSPQLAVNSALSGRAMAALARRDWPAVIEAYRAIPGYDNDAEVLKRMAEAETGLGRHDEAIATADKALLLDPRNPDMLHMAGLVRLNAGRERDMAQSLMRKALELDPSNRIFKADYARAMN